MYTEEQRTKWIERLTLAAENMEDIQGVVLVGSGAYGFRDPYSDVDLVLVAKSSDAVPRIRAAWVSMLQQTQMVLKHKVYRHQPDIWVSCFLLDGYLEMDVGIWSLNKIRATKAHWKVLYDQSAPDIETRLQNTLTEPRAQAGQAAEDSTTLMWQFIRGASVALSRGHAMKAMKEMEYLRDKIAELTLLRDGIAGDISKELWRVSRLMDTYAGSMDTMGLYEKLWTTVEMYFDVLSSILGEDGVQRDRQMARDMVQDLTAKARTRAQHATENSKVAQAEAAPD